MIKHDSKGAVNHWKYTYPGPLMRLVFIALHPNYGDLFSLEKEN
jgi:hypothetical protein